MKKMFVFVIIVLGLIAGAVGLGIRIKSEWEISSKEWDGQERIVMGLMTEDEETGAILLSLEPSTESLFIMRLPSNLYMNVSRGYGKYAVKSLPALARQELNWKLVTESLSYLIGSPVENWMVAGGPFDCAEIDAKCVEKILVKDLQRKEVESSVNRMTRWRLAETIKRLNLKSVIVDGGSVSWKQEEMAADGNQELTYAADYVDARLAGKFSDKRVIDEALAIGVVNASDRNGEAGKVGRLISGMGGRVIKLDSIKSEVDNCLSRATNQTIENSVTVRRIKEYWDCTTEVRESSGRVDVEVWIGSLLN